MLLLAAIALVVMTVLYLRQKSQIRELLAKNAEQEELLKLLVKVQEPSEEEEEEEEEAPEVPEVPEVPEAPEAPEVPEAPGASEQSEAPEQATPPSVATGQDHDSVGKLNEHLIEAMHKLMEEDRYFLGENISIDDMAHQLGTNRTYVTRMMREEYGLTFIEYINVARIQYSQKLLYTSPDITLEEVAMKSGFQSTSNYCRAFKRYTGSTPKGWQQDTVG